MRSRLVQPPINSVSRSSRAHEAVKLSCRPFADLDCASILASLRPLTTTHCPFRFLAELHRQSEAKTAELLKEALRDHSADYAKRQVKTIHDVSTRIEEAMSRTHAVTQAQLNNVSSSASRCVSSATFSYVDRWRQLHFMPYPTSICRFVPR